MSRITIALNLNYVKGSWKSGSTTPDTVRSLALHEDTSKFPDTVRWLLPNSRMKRTAKKQLTATSKLNQRVGSMVRRPYIN